MIMRDRLEGKQFLVRELFLNTLFWRRKGGKREKSEEKCPFGGRGCHLLEAGGLMSGKRGWLVGPFVRTVTLTPSSGAWTAPLQHPSPAGGREGGGLQVGVATGWVAGELASQGEGRGL